MICVTCNARICFKIQSIDPSIRVMVPTLVPGGRSLAHYYHSGLGPSSLHVL